MSEESRASDYPQPSFIRKSAHIRGIRQLVAPEIPPPPTENLSNMVVHGARPYDALQARQVVTVHEAPMVYPMTYAAQRMLATGVRPDYTRGAATQIMVVHQAVV